MFCGNNFLGVAVEQLFKHFWDKKILDSTQGESKIFGKTLRRYSAYQSKQYYTLRIFRNVKHGYQQHSWVLQVFSRLLEITDFGPETFLISGI